MKAVSLWGDRILWADDVARMFGVSPSSVKRWVRLGYLTGKKAGRRYYFTTDDVKAFTKHGTAGIMEKDKAHREQLRLAEEQARLQAEQARIAAEKLYQAKMAWLQAHEPEKYKAYREQVNAWNAAIKAGTVKGMTYPVMPTVPTDAEIGAWSTAQA